MEFDLIPPKEIPQDLLKGFSMDGKIAIIHLYCNNTQSKPTIYTKEHFKIATENNLERKRGHYGIVDDWLNEALDAYRLGEKTAVIGSANQGYGPWYEGMCLARGSNDISIIEYNTVITQNEYIGQIHGFPPNNFYNSILSISTFEHSGLSRYGDEIDPDGDLKAMKEAYRILKPEGLLYLAVPIGKDKVVFNAHRIYGSVRLPILLEGWKVLKTFGFEDEYLDRDTGLGWDSNNKELPEYSPIWVLKKKKE